MFGPSREPSSLQLVLSGSTSEKPNHTLPFFHPGMQWILEAIGVRKNFGALQAVAGADLRLERGQITMLIGPNGSGKTTFINIVSGLYKPDAGVIICNGTEFTGY